MAHQIFDYGLGGTENIGGTSSKNISRAGKTSNVTDFSLSVAIPTGIVTASLTMDAHGNQSS